MSETASHQLLRMAHGGSVLKAGEAARLGIHSQHLTRLVAAGILERIARGQYRLAEGSLTEHHGLAVVTRAVPRGVICLLSALSFHGIGTQLPFEVWVAIDRRAHAPKLRHPPMRVVRFGGAAFTEGVEDHRVEGAPIRVYGVAKTLADLFKFRNKIGLDVALEALREAWRDHRFTLDELDHYSRVCRVEKVIRPYVEALVT